MKDKKNVIFLIAAIFIFLIALFFAIWTNGSNKNTNTNANKSNQEIMDELSKDEESHTTDLEAKYQDFSILDNIGEEVKLSDYKDSAVMVLFWNSENPESVEMLNRVNELYDSYKDKIKFLAINTKDEDVKEILENINVPVFYDRNGEVANMYGITTLPAMLYINSNNEIFNSKTGLTSRDALQANLDILAENF